MIDLDHNNCWHNTIECSLTPFPHDITADNVTISRHRLHKLSRISCVKHNTAHKQKVRITARRHHINIYCRIKTRQTARLVSRSIHTNVYTDRPRAGFRRRTSGSILWRCRACVRACVRVSVGIHVSMDTNRKVSIGTPPITACIYRQAEEQA